ncbi:MAG: ABC transporter ATP-binding protein [Chloroflexota bacterium]
MSELKVSDVTKNFGGVQAVNNVSISVNSGERYAVIGPNGAGKSTFFNLISGELPVTSGRIWLDGQEITNVSVNECANLGIGRTFQRNNLFLGMTALENIRIAVQHKHGITRNLFRPLSAFRRVSEAAGEVLEQVGLIDMRDRKVSELAYGQQRALEMALALATQPKILLLDEPTAGMSPAETADMVKLIQSLPRTLTMMIVEHDMDVIFNIADRITVLHYGEVITTGTPDEVRHNSTVREIYLGSTEI